MARDPMLLRSRFVLAWPLATWSWSWLTLRWERCWRSLAALYFSVAASAWT
ncbi:hypothetical protein [Wenjunlia vitaminophila]|uniref:hypothetical protein n=1 Tax=Wenjunlia vitaminophila TaxID=76728 RepID=UPI002AFDD5F0|nr:hypothetical protein [Wenjunlia vitaminophila]